MSNVACCQNCTHCTAIVPMLNIGLCVIDENENKPICLKDVCEGFMWNYENDDEHKLD